MNIIFSSLILIKVTSTKFVTYTKGDIGIIIAVPHGGLQSPWDIPDRRYGTFEGDDHTKELGQVVAKSICRSLGKCPHLVISELRRKKLDPNREIRLAAQGNPKAEMAWREYHGLIDQAKQKEGVGVVIDLHGQSHGRNSTELGYLLSRDQLNRGDYGAQGSSIRSLSTLRRKTGREIMIGSESLGAFIEDEGYKAVPSPRQHSPGNQPFFPGYYTVERHGSRDGGRFDSISVETPREVRIDAGRSTRLKFGEDLGRAISNFYKANYY